MCAHNYAFGWHQSVESPMRVSSPPMRNGLPNYDGFNRLWVTLTVCGLTRKGYVHAGGRSRGDAVKEVIGEPIRHAAMRFGRGLQLCIGAAPEPEREPGMRQAQT
jgi:hypothetical protein